MSGASCLLHTQKQTATHCSWGIRRISRQSPCAFGRLKSPVERASQTHARRHACLLNHASLRGGGPHSLTSWRRGHLRRGRRLTSVLALTVAVESAGTNSRCCYAGVTIMAPVESVWGALTDYEGLGNFIPGLAENRCLSRNPKGARLLQVGEQDVAFGAKFRAQVVLDIQECYEGVPMDDCCLGKLGLTDGKYPLPRGLAKAPAHDIAFRMVEGDFQAFRGIWRMQQRREQDPPSTYLSYSVYVRPQLWLPVRLIQGRIQGEISANLCAVRQHSEALWRRSQKPSQVTSGS